MKKIFVYIAFGSLCFSLKAQMICSFHYDLSQYPQFGSVLLFGPGGLEFQSNAARDSVSFPIDEPEDCMLLINDSLRFRFFAENGTVKMLFDAAANKMEFNTELNRDFQIMLDLRQAVNTVTDNFLGRFRENGTFSPDSIMSIFYETENLYLLNEYYFALSKPGSFLNLALLKFLLKTNNDQLDTRKLFANLDPSLQQYPSYKLIQWSLQAGEGLVAYQDGDTVRADTLINIEGKSTTINDLLSPGKYLYLDFWSPDCGGTRVYREALVDLRKQYTGQIDFVSIAANSDWSRIGAINDALGIDWDNYVCRNESLNPIFKKFKILDNVIGFLIDANGKIVLSNIHPAWLEGALHHVLGQEAGE